MGDEDIDDSYYADLIGRVDSAIEETREEGSTPLLIFDNDWAAIKAEHSVLGLFHSHPSAVVAMPQTQKLWLAIFVAMLQLVLATQFVAWEFAGWWFLSALLLIIVHQGLTPLFKLMLTRATALHLEHVWPYSAVVGILVESVVAMILLAQLPLDKKPNGEASEAQEAMVLFFVTYVLNMLIEGGTIALRRRHCPGLCTYSHTEKGGLGLGLANSDFGKLPSEGGDEL